MTCNTISLVSRLIWKRFRWKFIDIFEDVCSLHTCFSADSLHLLCCIMPCESSGRFFRTTLYDTVTDKIHSIHCIIQWATTMSVLLTRCGYHRAGVKMYSPLYRNQTVHQHNFHYTDYEAWQCIDIAGWTTSSVYKTCSSYPQGCLFRSQFYLE